MLILYNEIKLQEASNYYYCTYVSLVCEETKRVGNMEFVVRLV